MPSRTVPALLLAALTGCSIDNVPFECSADAECTFEGETGRCEGTGHCSFGDDGCASGRRYGELADADLAGACVERSCVVAISAGGRHTCALTDAGKLYCWGADDVGQVGVSLGTDHALAQRVDVPPVSRIAAGGEHTCALVDGDVWCWGAPLAATGKAGPGAIAPGSIGLPESLRGAAEVAAGARSVAIVVGGKVATWGELHDNTGDGTMLAPTPLPMGDLNADALAVGGSHGCLRDLAGNLHCWGFDSSGQLRGRSTDGYSAEPIAMDLPAAELGAGLLHTCTLSAERVACWGDNSRSQLGPGVTSQGSALPKEVPLSPGASALAVGHHHSCAASGASVACWGSNQFAQLGASGPAESPAPVIVRLGQAVERVAAGGDHTCALDTAGDIWCWGRNAAGQLGTGQPSETPSAQPRRVSLPPDACD